MMSVESGNLLDADAEALVNTVNTVGVMGKGIALEFKRAFPENFRAYARACKSGEVHLGRMFVAEIGTGGNPRLIVNFPTKKHWRSGSRLEDIESGLRDLRQVIEARQIRSIAIPPLGCGHGGLDWDDVHPLVVGALHDLDDVHVLLFPPDGAPTPGGSDDSCTSNAVPMSLR